MESSNKNHSTSSSPTPLFTIVHIDMESPGPEVEQGANESPGKFAEYRDFSHVPPSEVNVGDKKRYKEPSFPMKLHMLVSNPDFEHIICWLPHGRSWKILDFRDFEEIIIPLYFRHGRYSSFARQVNGWGFKRVTQGPDCGSYYHEKFLRGLPHVCRLMRRQNRRDPATHNETVSNDKKILPPNFCEISAKNPLPEKTRRTTSVPPSTLRLTVSAPAASGNKSHDLIMAKLRNSLIERESRIKILKQLSLAQDREQMDAKAANNAVGFSQQMRVSGELPNSALLIGSQAPLQPSTKETRTSSLVAQRQQQLLNAGMSSSLLRSRKGGMTLQNQDSATATLHADAPITTLSDLTALISSYQALRQATEEAARATAAQQRQRQQQHISSIVSSSDHVLRHQLVFEDAMRALGIVHHLSNTAADDKWTPLLLQSQATQVLFQATHASEAGVQQQSLSSFNNLNSRLPQSQAARHHDVLPTNNKSYAGLPLDNNKQLVSLLFRRESGIAREGTCNNQRKTNSITAAQWQHNVAGVYRQQQKSSNSSQAYSVSSGGGGPLKQRTAVPTRQLLEAYHQPNNKMDPTTAAILQALQQQQQEHDMLMAWLRKQT